MLKKIFYSFLTLLAVLVLVIVVRTLALTPQETGKVEKAEAVNVDGAKVAELLGGALRIQTISHPDSSLDKHDQFIELHAYLTRSFPRAHAVLNRETVDCCSLLYQWKGKNPSLKPVLLMAHLDVVPVEPGTETRWKQPPFSGGIVENEVWGRGAIDDKGSMIALFQAIELSAAQGFQPERTIYAALGQDEEVGGFRGTQSIAALLKKRGITFEFVLDEGGSVTQGIVGGINRPVALVGIVEKGYVTLELTAHGKGGHASTPPPHTAAGILGRAVARLEDKQFPSKMTDPVRQMLRALGPHMPFAQRMAAANLWIFESMIIRQMAKMPATAASLRTTTAPTVLWGSPQENVLPSQAVALVNFRILPGETTASTLERAVKVVNNKDVTIVSLKRFISEPSKVSSTDSLAYKRISGNIRRVYPDAVVAPMMVLGATDSRHYEALTENTYRFFPFLLGPPDLLRTHGTDEMLSVENLERGVRFYHNLLHDL